MKKILVLYYSQTGQLKNIVNSVTKPLQNCNDIELTFTNYSPIQAYSFPWTSEDFFDAFPESVNGIPCKLKPLDCDIEKDYDLIILAYQVWYLSPSIPTWSLLCDDRYSNIFKGKNVITILGVRNMWIGAHKKLSKKLTDIGSSHIGNIVLTDPYPNLISVVTVIKWMTTGNQGPYKFFPRSGVKQESVESATAFGYIIKEAIEKNSYDDLQENLVANNAVNIDFTLKTTEQSGLNIFKIWSKFILKKGGAGNKDRRNRIRLFKYFLMTLIFVISPISTVLFKIINLLFYPILNSKHKKIKLLKE
ncbi:hypothetical protein ACXR6G_16285 [Ancylomarina sp. YFZ004]